MRSTAPDRTASLPPGSFKVAALSPELPYPLPTVKQSHTGLIGFDNSAFPKSGGRYSDNRVLVHVPAGFDVRKPGVIVVSGQVNRGTGRAKLGRHPDQVGEGVRFHFLHDLSSMRFNGNLADAEFAANLFIQQAGHN